MTDAELVDYFGCKPYFVDEVIRDYGRETEKWPFRKYVSWCHEGSVNIMRICGTQHPDYVGLTWREFLSKGRRMKANLTSFRQNPTYYTDIVRRLPGMFLNIVDGRGYVTTDGNHRTCIGKCFLYDKDSPFMHGVNVSEQQTDLRMLALYSRLLEKLPGYCKAEPVATEIARDDGNGWGTHFFDVRVRVVNGRRKGHERIFDADELEDGLLSALRNPLAARFGEYKKLLF
jgi:hypothetical protein